MQILLDPGWRRQPGDLAIATVKSNTINLVDIIVNSDICHQQFLNFFSVGPKFYGRCLTGGCQTPLILQVALHALEHDTVDDVADGDDQDHDRDNGAHIVQIAAHHQYLA